MVGVEDPEDVDVEEAEADLVVVPGAKISHFGSFYCKSGTCCGAIKMQPYYRLLIFPSSVSVCNNLTRDRKFCFRL